MGREPIEFLTYIGLARDQDRLLMQAIQIEALGSVEEDRDLLGDTGLDRLGPAAGRRFRARGEPANLAQPLAQDAPQSLTLVSAHCGKLRHAVVKPGNHRRLCSAPLLLVLVCVRDLDHAFE